MIGKLQSPNLRPKMRDKFFQWLTGTPQPILGAWWDRAGVCLVRMSNRDVSTHAFEVVYEQISALLGHDSIPNPDGVVKAIGCAVERLNAKKHSLALGVPSEDVFIKSIEIPGGLTDKQVEQLSIVEAVSNLPVPPEEVCADFLRFKERHAALAERIEIAFCKRDLIDSLSVIAEDARVSVTIVDRDIQGIHDAVAWFGNNQLNQFEIVYPIGILISDAAVTFQVSKSDLNHVLYSVVETGNMQTIASELQACCRRAGLSYESSCELEQLYVVSSSAGALRESAVDGLAKRVMWITPADALEGDTSQAPLFGLLAAMGMSLRGVV